MGKLWSADWQEEESWQIFIQSTAKVQYRGNSLVRTMHSNGD